MNLFYQLRKQKLSQLFLKISLIWLGLSVIMGVNTRSVLAAEEIIFTHGVASQSVAIEDLEKFAATGEMSSSLEFLFDFSQQNPQVARYILNQQLPAETILIANLLNSTPGEFLLGETSQIVHSRSKRANVQALRGSIVQSASDDNRVSLLEILQNYPTQQVYVDGRLLSRTVRNVNTLINNSDKYNDLKVPIRYLKELMDSF